MPKPRTLLHMFSLVLLSLVLRSEGQAMHACTVEPCQNGGTCLISSHKPSEFLCHCTEFYNGTYCENYVGPTDCERDPCLNGGSCLQGPNNRIWCECPEQYSGLLCHQFDVSPCDSSPCQHEGECTNHDLGFRCSCAAGYAGATCSLSIRTACASHPCANGGSCFVSSFDVKDYYCVCPTGFYGDHCHLSVVECSCENGGVCQNTNLPEGGIGLYCLCPPGYSGTRCEISPGSVCDVEPCIRGDCFLHATNQSEYYCSCEDGYAGERCDIRVTPGSCTNNPCMNSGACLSVFAPSGTEYTFCECPPGYTGLYCEQSTEGCSPNPCLNGGLCLASSPTTITCQCSVGYVGLRCQYRGACHSNPCLNNGTCFNAYQPQSNMPGFACACQGDYHGLTCNETSDDLCASSPCRNGGICLENVEENQLACICPVGYTGDKCQRREGALCAANPSVCSGPGEVCVDNGDYFYCECQGSWRRTDDDTGCHAPCTISPCQNDGECFLLADREEFYCVCPEGYTGEVCEAPFGPCESCKHGGMCVTYSTAFYCECVGGYSGIDCSEPPMSPPTTVYPDYPCFDGACKNGGTCMPFIQAGGYHCMCPNGFTGLDCSDDIRATTQQPPPTTEGTTTTMLLIPPNSDICTSIFSQNPCVNGAICLPNTDLKGQLYPMCLCRQGYGGATCSVRLPVPPVCQKNPCGPGASCYSNASSITGYSCICLRPDGFCGGGIIAGTAPPSLGSPCDSSPCLNNGSCVADGDFFRCDCPVYIVGDLCETDIRECTYKDTRFREGEIRSEGCLECNCTNGDWQCTEDNCYCEHGDKLYENGQTWTDLCMTCFCYDGGWLCSDSDCTLRHLLPCPGGPRHCAATRVDRPPLSVLTGAGRDVAGCACAHGAPLLRGGTPGGKCRLEHCNTCEHDGNRYFSGDILEESCQTCFCSNKNWTCTMKANCDYCSDYDAVYFEGSVRKDDCNVCTCTSQGWQCTVKNCDELPLTVNISFHLDYPFSLIADRQADLIRVIKAHMEARCNLHLDQLIGIWLSEGSIVVNMTLYEDDGTDQDIRHVAQKIKEKVSSGTLKIAFDGYLITAKADSYSEVIISQRVESSIPILFILSAVVLLLIIVTLPISVCLCRKSRRSLGQNRKSPSRRRLFKSRGSESSDDTPGSPSWDNKGGEDSKQPEVFSLPHRDKVMTCPGRLRQVGLDGIAEEP